LDFLNMGTAAFCQYYFSEWENNLLLVSETLKCTFLLCLEYSEPVYC
jgi:hypothetical protein